MQDSTSRPDGAGQERRRKGSSLPLDVIEYIDGRIDEKFSQAFVDGNAEKHKQDHKELIEAANDRRALWKSVREKVVSGGVWAGLLVMGTALVEWAKREIVK